MEYPIDTSSGNTELISLLELHARIKATGVANVRVCGSTGKIYLKEGEFVNAEFLHKEGEPACLELLRLPSGEVDWEDGVEAPCIQEHEPLDLLLIHFLGGLQDDSPVSLEEIKFAEERNDVHHLVHSEHESHYVCLEVLNGSCEGMRYVMKTASLIIGADGSCDLILPEPTVSRHHCRLEIHGDGIYLTDLNSCNGTRINGHAAFDEPIKPNDMIHAGQTSLRVEMHPRRAAFISGLSNGTCIHQAHEENPEVLSIRQTEPIRWAETHPDQDQEKTKTRKIGF